jgi:hypothetical protein
LQTQAFSALVGCFAKKGTSSENAINPHCIDHILSLHIREDRPAAADGGA